MGGSATPESGKSTSGSGPSGSAGSVPGKATTTDERRAGIDRKLDDSLGTLDREIRKEQEKTAQERDARAAANAGNNGSADSDHSGDDSDSKHDGDLKSGGSADTDAQKGGKDGDRKSRAGDLKSEKQGNGKDSNGKDNAGGAQGSGSAAPSIPDGSDDDIVARRLRKAAEQETDPELKEKLWKEYVEYKKNSGK